MSQTQIHALRAPRQDVLLYGGVALGIAAGAAISTYLYRRRMDSLDLLNLSPIDRAEQIIANCENKLDSIEKAVSELKDAQPEGA